MMLLSLDMKDVSFPQRPEAGNFPQVDRLSVCSDDVIASVPVGKLKGRKGRSRGGGDEKFALRGRDDEQVAFGQAFKTRQEKEKFISEKLMERLQHLKAMLEKMLPRSKPPYGEHVVGAFTIALADTDLKVCSNFFLCSNWLIY